MSGRNSNADRSPGAGSRFATTHWSLILPAGGSTSTRAHAALSQLCTIYWFPIYAYLRRKGYERALAEDLTQEFFARLLERQDLQRVAPERGRFRSFLLAALRHFLANEWDKAQATKRGGGQRPLSLDFQSAEDRYRTGPGHTRTPEVLFERQWALALLEQVRAALRQEFCNVGKAQQFAQLEIYLTGDPQSAPYAKVARKLDMTEAAVKVAVHRLRRRFRDRLRAEIAQTVTTEEEIDEEICALFEALRR